MQLDLVDSLADRPVKPKAAGALRTIGEVADELDVPQHVLRFWESKFPQLSPLKRRGGRRYYRPRDVELLHRIKRLLYEEGYTIRGATQLVGRAPKGEPVLPDPSDDMHELSITPTTGKANPGKTAPEKMPPSSLHHAPSFDISPPPAIPASVDRQAVHAVLEELCETRRLLLSQPSKERL